MTKTEPNMRKGEENTEGCPKKLKGEPNEHNCIFMGVFTLSFFNSNQIH